MTFCAIHTSPWARLNELAYQSEWIRLRWAHPRRTPPRLYARAWRCRPLTGASQELSNFLDMAPGELFTAPAVHDAHPNERPTTSTCRWSATATRTLSSNPKPSPPATPLSCSNGSGLRRPPNSSTTLSQLSDPAARPVDAVQRDTDGLKVAAEQFVGLQIVHTLDGRTDQVIPEAASERSWPTLSPPADCRRRPRPSDRGGHGGCTRLAPPGPRTTDP